MAEWKNHITEAAERQLQKYGRSHSRETISVNTNLKRILVMLGAGARVGTFRFNFFQSEGDGLYRIGQTGVQGAKETRLYVYPDEAEATVYVLGIGDKDSQERDIRAAKTAVTDLRRAAQEKKGQP